MQKSLTWYWLLLKAGWIKIGNWILLLVMAMLVFLVTAIRIPDGENMSAGICVTEDVCARMVVEQLLAEDSVFDFQVYSDEEQIYQDVRAGKLECGLVFDRDFEQKVKQQELDAVVTCITTPYTTKSAVIKETFFAAFYQVYSNEIIKESEKQIFSDDNAERTARMIAKSQTYRNSSDLFHVDQVLEDTATEEQAQDETTLYPVQGLVGLTIVLMTFLAGGNCYQGRRKGLKQFLSRRDRYLFMYLYEIAAVTPVAVMGVVLITAQHRSRGLGREVLLIFLLVLLCGVWNLVLTSFLKSETAVVACLVAVAVGHIVMYPIFFDLSFYIPTVRYLRYLSPLGIYL